MLHSAYPFMIQYMYTEELIHEPKFRNSFFLTEILMVNATLTCASFSCVFWILKRNVSLNDPWNVISIWVYDLTSLVILNMTFFGVIAMTCDWTKNVTLIFYDSNESGMKNVHVSCGFSQVYLTFHVTENAAS